MTHPATTNRTCFCPCHVSHQPHTNPEECLQLTGADTRHPGEVSGRIQKVIFFLSTWLKPPRQGIKHPKEPLPPASWYPGTRLRVRSSSCLGATKVCTRSTKQSRVYPRNTGVHMSSSPLGMDRMSLQSFSLIAKLHLELFLQRNQ